MANRQLACCWLLTISTFILLLGVTQNTCADTSPTTGPLQFQLTFSNPNATPLFLIKAGLKIHHAQGNASCKGFSRLVTPLADYVVAFSVGRERSDGIVTVDAVPPLEIPPKQSRTFTIAAAPNSAGTCGEWALEVNPVSIFSDGTQVVGSTYSLTAEDARKFETITPDDQKLIEYLRSPRSDLRAQGLRFLSAKSDQFDDLSLQGLLEHKFSDPSSEVRSLAADIAGKRRLRGLAVPISNLLNKWDLATTVGTSEAISYIRALGKLGGPEAARSIYRTTQSCEAFAADNCDAAIEAAKELLDQSLPQSADAALRKFLAQNQHAFKQDQFGQVRGFSQYGNIRVLIAYRWRESVPLFAQLLSDEHYAGVRWGVVEYMARSITHYDSCGVLELPSTVEEDAFINANRQLYRKLALETDFQARADALLLYFSTSKDVEDVRPLIKSGILSSDDHVSVLSAGAAGNFDLKEEISSIESKYKDAHEEWSKRNYCQSMRKLGRQLKCGQC